MGSKRRQHSAAFKAKVAIEALKEQKTISELASHYQLHPNQITKWKSEFVENSAMIFSNGHDKSAKEYEREKEELYKQIGQMKVEIDWLKKKLF